MSWLRTSTSSRLTADQAWPLREDLCLELVAFKCWWRRAGPAGGRMPARLPPLPPGEAGGFNAVQKLLTTDPMEASLEAARNRLGHPGCVRCIEDLRGQPAVKVSGKMAQTPEIVG